MKLKLNQNFINKDILYIRIDFHLKTILVVKISPRRCRKNTFFFFFSSSFSSLSADDKNVSTFSKTHLSNKDGSLDAKSISFESYEWG